MSDDTQYLSQWCNNLQMQNRMPLQPRVYEVSETIVVKSSMGLKLCGAGGRARSDKPAWDRWQATTRLVWKGPANRPMFVLSGCGLVLEGLNFWGADVGIEVTHGNGSLDWAIRDCGFIGQKVGIRWGTAVRESTCANCTYDNVYWECKDAGVQIVNGQSLEHLFLRPKWAYIKRCIDVQCGGRVSVIGGGPYNCGTLLHLGQIGGNARGFHFADVRFDGKTMRQAWLTVDDTDRPQGYGTITFSNASQNDGQSGDVSLPLVTVPPGARVILRDCSFNGSMENWAKVYGHARANGELSVQDCDGISVSQFQTLVEAKHARAYYEFARCGAIWGERGSFSTFPDAR